MEKINAIYVLIAQMVLIIFPIYIFFVSIIMVFPHKLSKKDRDIISRLGLVHFTTEEAAEKILSTSVIKTNKKKHYTYFFQNGIVTMDAISYNNLENKKVRVEILNLTEQQLKHLRIRYYDMAISCLGDFNFSDTNQVSVKSEPNISFAHSNLHPYRMAMEPMVLISFIAATCAIIQLPYISTLIQTIFR